jgi:hypothetical protein
LARLRRAAGDGHLQADADLDSVANALIGTLLLRVLTGIPAVARPRPSSTDSSTRFSTAPRADL